MEKQTRNLLGSSSGDKEYIKRRVSALFFFWTLLRTVTGDTIIISSKKKAEGRTGLLAFPRPHRRSCLDYVSSPLLEPQEPRFRGFFFDSLKRLGVSKNLRSHSG